MTVKSFLKGKCFVAMLLVFFIGDDFLFLAPYIKGHFSKDESAYFDKNASDKDVIDAVLKASLSVEESQMIQQEYRGLKDDLRSLFIPERNSENYNNYYMAYNLAGLSQYALKYKDDNIVSRLREKADKWITPEGNLTYELKRIDQCPIGILYINLYKLTKEAKYKKIADSIYKYLKDHRMNGNLIPYNNSVNNLSDAVGMYVPFLIEYNSLTGDTLARRIAIDNIELYKRDGCDAITHLPFHGYNIESGVKLGASNWGRGMGWFLLAVAYCTETNDSILQKSVSELPYTQFPLSNDHFDSSTALLFEIYKQATEPTREFTLDFIRTHIHTNGFVGDCSGDTYAPNDYSHSFGNNELCNGLLLLLCSKFFY